MAWLARTTGASLLIAGFGCGLMVAALGRPKRLSTEVLGVAGGRVTSPTQAAAIITAALSQPGCVRRRRNTSGEPCL